MMKTITYEQFLKIDPYYHDGSEKHALMAAIAARREHWSALDILELSEIPAEDRLWYALREELIDAPLLHEFACRCAERALNRVKIPDPRSLRAIEVKRAWLRGEATDDELDAAWHDAAEALWDIVHAAIRNAAWAAAQAAARAAVRSAVRHAGVAARSSVQSVQSAIEAAIWSKSDIAKRAEQTAQTEYRWQIEELQKMLKEQED